MLAQYPRYFVIKILRFNFFITKHNTSVLVGQPRFIINLLLSTFYQQLVNIAGYFTIIILLL